MMMYLDEEDGIYALSRAPLKRLAWGSSGPSMLRLCKHGSNQPVTVWIVGSIATLWLYDSRSGDPKEKISVGVKPLAQHAMNVARTMMQKLPKPSGSEWLRD